MEPTPDIPESGPWTTATQLAARLGITTTTLRRHLANPATEVWLPRPQMIASRLVWPTEALAGIEGRDRPKPGNPNWRRTTPPAVSSEPPTS